MKPFSIIVGYRASDRAIGAKGKLPWHIPKDMNFFRKTTTTTEILTHKNVVIMGRNTFESMHCKPLAGRINFVCTSMDMIDMPDMHVYFVKTLDDALKICHKMSGIQKVFVIGGEQLYRYAIDHPLCEELIVNEFSKCSHMDEFDIDKIPCDTFFPEIDENEYELILDYISLDSISEIKPTIMFHTDHPSPPIVQSHDQLSSVSCNFFVKIRYKKYIRTTV